MPLTALTGVRDPSVRGAVRRLSDEFPGVGTRSIAVVVNTCREELRGSPDGALPELVERLARQRLQATVPEATGSACA
jgi:hypothetical protein